MTDTSDGDGDEAGRPSQLFLIRVWIREAGGDQPRWYGRVQHVVTGEVHHFQGGAELAEALLNMIPGALRAEYSTSPASSRQADPQAALDHSQSAVRKPQVREERRRC